MPRGTPELTVGGRAQTHIALHANHVADGVVLDGTQLVGADLAGGLLLARFEQNGRAKQAATWSARNGGMSRSVIADPSVVFTVMNTLPLANGSGDERSQAIEGDVAGKDQGSGRSQAPERHARFE